MKSTKIILSTSVVFIALALVLAPLALSDDALAKKKSNEALQDLGQSSATGQNATCSSETGTTLASCNNVALSFNLNDGNQALGQQ